MRLTPPARLGKSPPRDALEGEGRVGQVLNCIWALLSVWMFVHWVWRSPAGRSAGRSGLCGLVCTLTLLFPVISANDDLLQREFWNAPVSPILKSILKATTSCESGATPMCAASCELCLSRAVHKFIAADVASLLSVLSLGATGDRSPPRLASYHFHFPGCDAASGPFQARLLSAPPCLAFRN